MGTMDRLLSWKRVLAGCLLMAFFFLYIKMLRQHPSISASPLYNVDVAREEALAAEQCTPSVCSQQERFARLRRSCHKYPELSTEFDPDKHTTFGCLLVDDHHKVLYCALPKAASTTMYNMFYLAVTGRKLKDIHCRECWEKEGLVWLSRYPREERDRRLRDYFKIMVVRHPLDRFVSCWNNKFAYMPHPHSTWLQNGPRMISMFRKIPWGSTLEKEIKKGAEFNEFVQYVNYLEENSPKEHDQHWRAHNRLCHPCNIEYDLIAKVETMQRDSRFIMDRLNLTGKELPLINARRLEEEDTLQVHKNLDTYHGVPRSHFDGIKRFYRWDMELFDYKWNDSLLQASCGGKCDSPGCC